MINPNDTADEALQITLKSEVHGLRELQMEIGKWSRHNFKNQPSHVIVGSPALGSLLPLLGMAEEVGELFAAKNVEETIDAIADIGIYLLDWATRENIVIDTLIKDQSNKVRQDPMSGIVQMVGLLNRYTLKRHQGIDVYRDDSRYKEDRNKAAVRLYFYLEKYCEDHGTPPFVDILTQVYIKQVLPRDWAKNPENAKKV